MDLLKGVEVPQINSWLENGLSATHPFSIQMKYLRVSLKTLYRILEKIEGPTENQEDSIAMSVKQQVTPTTLVKKLSTIAMHVGRITCETTSTHFRGRVVQ